MTPTQIGALLLSLLAVGAGAVGAAAVSNDGQVGPPPWANDDREHDINVSVAGNVTPGETVTLTATLHGEPVPHAPVSVNGEHVGETDADGRIDVTVPDADEFEVEIEPEFEGSTTVDLAGDGEDETDDGEEDEEREEADDSEDDDERSIDLAIDGNVTPNETVTVTATVNDTPLAGATISVNGEDVGTTDANGTIEVTVPEEANEFEVEAEYDHAGKLKVVFEEEPEDEAGEDDEREFDVTVNGNVSAGETVTVTATHDGTPVDNATVTLNDERVGTTDADGQLIVTLSDDLGDEVEVEVQTDDGEGEWEREFEDDDDEDENSDDDEDEDDES